MSQTAQTVRVFVGTYTQTTSKGIYVYDVDTDTGVMEYVSHVGGITNPSFLALTPDVRFLYAVGETGDPHGGVFAYAVDASGTLTPLNSRSTHGSGPCSIDVNRSGRAVLVANYGGGSVSSYPVNSDGSLGEAASVIQHTGSSVNQSRQQEPHAHMIRHDLDYNFVFLAGPRHRQGDDLRPRPGNRGAEPPRRGVRAARIRPPAHRVPSKPEVRLRHQRDGQHDHRFRL